MFRGFDEMRGNARIDASLVETYRVGAVLAADDKQTIYVTGESEHRLAPRLRRLANRVPDLEIANQAGEIRDYLLRLVS